MRGYTTPNSCPRIRTVHCTSPALKSQSRAWKKNPGALICSGSKNTPEEGEIGPKIITKYLAANREASHIYFFAYSRC